MPILLSARRTVRFAYWREIIAVLCLKAAGLAVLYLLFFSPTNQMIPTPQDVARHLVDRAFSREAGRGPRDETASQQNLKGQSWKVNHD